MIFQLSKTLPEIAKVVGLDQEQSQIIFTNLLGSERTRKQRLDLILHFKRKKIFLIIDETGDKKKGKRTDYVIGNI